MFTRISALNSAPWHGSRASVEGLEVCRPASPRRTPAKPMCAGWCLSVSVAWCICICCVSNLSWAHTPQEVGSLVSTQQKINCTCLLNIQGNRYQCLNYGNTLYVVIMGIDFRSPDNNPLKVSPAQMKYFLPSLHQNMHAQPSWGLYLPDADPAQKLFSIDFPAET